MSSLGSDDDVPAARGGVIEEKKSNKNEEEEDEELQEYIFGIEDRPIASWKKRPPLFEERIRATNQHTFLDIINELCNTAIRKRRRRFCSNNGGGEDSGDDDDGDAGSDDDDDENADCGIQDHLWEFKMYDPKYKPFDPLCMDEMDDEMEEREPTGIRIAYELDRDEMNDYRYNVRNISPRTMLSQRVLPLGHVGSFQYDFSHTTEIYLKVLSIRTIHRGGGGENVNKDSIFGYCVEVGDQTSNERDLFSMSAYHLPEDEQIDAFYPNFARACLGKGVPLYQSSSQHPGGGGGRANNNWTTGKLTMGLATKISEQDTTFCALEDSSNSNDLLFCPDVMDLTTLFTACEEAWTPKECHPRDDPDALYGYEYGWICRFVLNKDNHEGIEKLQQMAENGWGPKYILATTSSPSDIPPDKNFDFCSIFPRTAAHLTSGKFRWFTYSRNNVLRVAVGRAGKDRSIKDSNQVLRTWKQKFHSLHELFCAVEASWIDENGEPLEATTFLADFDADVGPSRPGPIDPPVLATETDAIVLSSPNSKKKLVTALSMAKENNGDLVVYCGHDDGTLAKWNLESGQLLFREQIYADGTNDYSTKRSSDYFSVCETGGVAGLIVREKKNQIDGHHDEHIIYTWTHAHSGYPNVGFNDRTSSTVKAWSGKDGKFLQSYECIVGNDEKGKPAHPSIACVVFCRLLSDNNTWQDSLIVGLHCLCPRTLYGTGDYSNFNLDAARSIGEGNILPFNAHSGERMETWRGHNGMIRALAIIPDKYLFSYSIRPGHGHADAMILWDLKRPGVPLSRLNLWDPNTTVFKQSLTRIYGVVGISVHGKNVLLACEYGYQVAVISVEEDDDESGGGGSSPALRVCGYASLCPRVYDGVSGFHGCMAMSGHVAAMASNDYQMTWLFNINEMASHAKLDRHDGNKFAYDKAVSDAEDDDDEEDRVDLYAGRHLVRGIVNFPEPTNRIIGGDGPIVLAMRGKYLVAGYANGMIVHVKLSDGFEQDNNTTTTTSSNIGEDGLTSCCWLSSSEWAKPALWHDKENDDAWSPFDMDKASRWGIDFSDDDDDDDGDDSSYDDDGDDDSVSDSDDE